MADQLKLYLFGDQTYDIQLHLKDLIRYRHNPVLEDFLVKAYDAIRTEIYKLPREIRDDLPRFTCLDDIICWKQGGKRCIPLDMAVTCMYQLGVFIRYGHFLHVKVQKLNNLYSQVDPQHYCGDNARILGLCTGALAAAAVSCSCSTLELIPRAVDAVIVAFRTGMHVTDVAQRVEPSDASDRSWSIIIPGLASGEAAVTRFCEQTVRIVLIHDLYISRLHFSVADFVPKLDTAPN